MSTNVIVVKSSSITTTSANRTGGPPAVKAWQIADAFPQGIDCILDAGPVSGGTGSTVVDLTGPEPVILREGTISREEILQCYSGSDQANTAK